MVFVGLSADFNPRSREGSDSAARRGTRCARLFQSTLPRRERPELRARSIGAFIISIHAPAKGATVVYGLLISGVLHFNPRSREGSDCCAFACCAISSDFNPRSREGSDACALEIGCVGMTFQSTLPRRERRGYAGQFIALDNHFNPRSREGSDQGTQGPQGPQGISIHAPAKGATVKVPAPITLCEFQSTLPRRERLFAFCHSAPSFLFQSTLPRRERQCNPCHKCQTPNNFNPRSREGSDT